MKRIVLFLILTLLLTVGFAANAQAEMQSYVIMSNGNDLPTNLAAQVAKANGSLDHVFSEIGIALASSSNPRFASRISGVQDVILDVGFTVEAPVQQFEYVADAAPEEDTTGNKGNGKGKGNKKNSSSETTAETTSIVGEETGVPPFSGDDDFFFDLQWGHDSVNAVEAWNAGVRGQGVRVAVLDTGFDLDHPDLAPNINLALSADFTGEGLQYTLPDTFSHGTHTAGTIAAADNGFGTIGVAPEAELVLVKVLSDEGSGDFGGIIAGIYHAALVDSDVISMSLGTLIPQNGDDEITAAEVAQLRVATARATTFAAQQGAIVIVSAGNDGHDLDGDGSIKRFMTGLPGTYGISATAPIGWATDPENADLDIPAYNYTNYGTSMVEFSAPGGNYVYPGNENCTVAGLTRPCWVLDFVFSTGNGGWYWSVGTSMAAPHAAGVAALIISENGGDMHPAQVAAEMRHRAEDLGPEGTDDYHGHGAVRSGY